MDLQSTAQAQSATIAQSTPRSGSTSVISSDFETFLKMLTAQAQYQDPLEPIDSSEYAAQLAQFSMVEQQVQTNELLQSMLGDEALGSIGQFAGWIGMDALSPSPVQFEGAPIELSANPPAQADDMQLVVIDANDREVQRLSIEPTNEAFDWAGVSEDGSPFAPGFFSFRFDHFGQGQLLGSEPAMTYKQITEARLEDGSPLLVLEDGNSISPSEVAGLRSLR